MATTTSKATVKPKYEVIKLALLKRLNADEWPVGGRFPSESELSREYGVSRMTVQRVMRDLVVAGVIDRVVGAGSFVARHNVRSSFVRVDDLTECETTAKGSREIVSQKTIPRCFLASRPILYLAARWRKSGLVTCAEQWLIDITGWDKQRGFSNPHVSMVDWIHEMRMIDSVDEQLGIRVPPLRSRRDLEISDTNARIVISRRFFSESKWVGLVRETYADRNLAVGRRYCTLEALSSLEAAKG